MKINMVLKLRPFREPLISVTGEGEGDGVSGEGCCSGSFIKHGDFPASHGVDPTRGKT